MRVDEALAGCGLPRAEALSLLVHASGWSRERLIAASREPLAVTARAVFEALSRRRCAGEPIAYLVGSREFYGRSFAVDRRVLIPRPETELLVDHALETIAANGGTRVLDLGCGSGAVGLTIALERPSLEVVATDRSVDALALAADNATRLGAVVRFAAGDWYDAVADERAFDLIVSNPPYVARDDPHLTIGDLRFEPAIALTDGADGTTALARIVAGARTRLTAQGALIVEHGHLQAPAVRDLLAAAGFGRVGSRRDLAGIERISFGTVGVDL